MRVLIYKTHKNNLKNYFDVISIALFTVTVKQCDKGLLMSLIMLPL